MRRIDYLIFKRCEIKLSNAKGIQEVKCLCRKIGKIVESIERFEYSKL